ncbi:MAG: hypothetical protein US60_C0009G0021 [Microgenomates group bacterium GW2011_GWC1_37_8]|uniref:DUF5666 domain-containing protein n=1 Tax=Candidatus Woesebacteria bacterium GW2011_GWB1_38_8 TaxID=1618570 RepID=A0A0G0NJ39_9BACT|nr:MAG: hypothetical protein US60_C0009G0021 [Microgenomates group bacterium GW2011_GWC1_37_8]KKQ85934.1 MAG: hypothetical protein UT08_C0003G0097 [Candidatus Woesebacteria bacterium GW2011_GWB1_38_8]
MRIFIFLFLMLSVLIIGIYRPISAQNSPAPTSGVDEGSVREKVKEKVETVRKNPKAYIGSVTDKTQDSIQIKNSKGEIQFVSINPDEVDFVKSTNKSTAIKFNDVAIGDYVIAMGYRNGNSVLTTKRLIVTTESTSERKIVYGTIKKIEKKEITVFDKNNQEFTFTFPKTWKGPEIKELSENDTLVLVAIAKDDKESIRTIELITSPSPDTEL